MDDKHDQVLAGKVFLVIQIHSLRVSAIKIELRMTREQTYKAPYHFDVASRWQYSPNTFSGSGFHVQDPQYTWKEVW